MSMIVMFVFSLVHCNRATAIMFSFTTAILVWVHCCISMTLQLRPRRQFYIVVVFGCYHSVDKLVGLQNILVNSEIYKVIKV